MVRRALVAQALSAVALFATAVQAVPISVLYVDQPGQGFLDAKFGAERRAALEFAADRWARTLGGTAPMVVAAAMVPLGGTGTDAVLASTGPVTLHRRSSGAQADTWYGAALGNQLAAADLNGPDLPEIAMTFNADVDGPEVLGSLGWYYGLDAQPGVNIDFVTIALHEFGHGLNFFDTVDPAAGGWRTGDGRPGIFDRMLYRPGVGGFAEMRDTERLAAVISGTLFWDGPNVAAFNGSAAPVYAPDPFRPGASLGHWDPTQLPDEIIGAFYTHAVHDLGLLLPALFDMGWLPAGPTPTPRAPAATPTVTPSLRPTAVPERTPQTRRDVAYVSNFDDGTISVVDRESGDVTHTIRVGDGPIGVAAAPNGRRVYVANFQDGTMSVIHTATNRVTATIAVGESPNGIAITPDGAVLVVTDTVADRAILVSTDTHSVTARVEAGVQPSAVALGAQGTLAFITNFAGHSVTVVDTDTQLRRAIMPLPQEGLGGIAIASAANVGVVTAYYSRSATYLDTAALSLARPVFAPGGVFAQPECVAVSGDGMLAYIASHDMATGKGSITVARPARGFQLVANVTTAIGRVPRALGFSPDGRWLYVANTGSDTVSIFQTASPGVLATAGVGRAPMGVAGAAVPMLCEADCDEDGTVTVAELLRAVGAALGEEVSVPCDAADGDGNGRVTIAELVRAVERALRGCP